MHMQLNDKHLVRWSTSKKDIKTRKNDQLHRNQVTELKLQIYDILLSY